MRHGSRRVLYLFLICLAFVMLAIPMNAAAKTGHGGATKVIARIEAPSNGQSSDPLPESSVQDPSGKESSTESRPVSTGDDSPLFYGMMAAVSLALIMATVNVSHTKQEKIMQQR